MGRLSEKFKILYLLLVILFAMGVFVYLLDSWDIIRLEEKIPLLAHEPPRVDESEDSPTEIELERLKKEMDRLKDEEIRLQEQASRLDEDKGAMQKERERLEELRKGLEDEKKKIEEQRKAELERARTIREMASRITAMPPDDAVAIMAGWSNPDLVDVFLQMEKNADEAGSASIVPYLMTKLPRERAALITSLMMDEEARQLPSIE